MEKFQRYLAAFDGTRDWSEIQPLFDEAFHPDLVVVTADGEMNKDQWAAMAKGLAERHATTSGFKFTAGDDDLVYYEVTVNISGEEPMHLTAKGSLEDGRLLRVEPVDPGAYSELVEQSG